MTKVIAGPFNRVEGDLEVGLDIEDGIILRAEVTTTLFRGFEKILGGRPPMDALVIAPRICGICSVSQSIAAASALRALAGGRAAPNGYLAANLAHAAENIADHLTHFYLFFMPDFARAEYADYEWFERAAARFKAVSGEASAQYLPARRRLLEIMGIIAGKWPHSLAFQPGGVTKAIDIGERIRLAAILADFQVFLEQTLFGASLDDILSLESEDDLEALRAKGNSDFRFFLDVADDLALRALGKGPGQLLSYGAYHEAEESLLPAGIATLEGVRAFDANAISEDVASSWFEDTSKNPFEAETSPDVKKDGAYSWAKSPRIDLEPMETGAAARLAVAGHPLVTALIARDGGTSVRTRVIARVVETAILVHSMQGWLRRMRLKEAFSSHFSIPDEAAAAGLVEAARGSLGHWVQLRKGQIQRYQIIAPTTWNFSPRDERGIAGPLEQALVGVETGALGAKSAALQHVIRSFDPCMVCTAH
ncbi:nickel-dependent hydrogenase large subunit [Rhizobium sp. L1K21]|uniref:nickel-dependent hydrogenase large subunit n=1 Tax=Rhizobium sp. L1K21 TaxID=2954933 RepID=UPI002093857C|nr:nickel-dependent hydrogenase large subunit [Rhizobium sp. L1K21]MCO6184604.1 nickel-dependent hydrogenase large subunit [Rhizobium sp. L1K21]